MKKMRWIGGFLVAAVLAGPAAANTEDHGDFYSYPPEDRFPYDPMPRNTMIEIGTQLAGGDVSEPFRQIIGLKFRGFEEHGSPGEHSRIFQLEGRMGVAFGSDGVKLPMAKIRLIPYQFESDGPAAIPSIQWFSVDFERNDMMGIEREINLKPIRGQFVSKDSEGLKLWAEVLSYAITHLLQDEGPSQTAHRLGIAKVGISTQEFRSQIGESLNFAVIMPTGEMDFGLIYYPTDGGISLKGHSFRARAHSEVALEFGRRDLSSLMGRVFLQVGVAFHSYMSPDPDAESGIDQTGYYVELGTQLHF